MDWIETLKRGVVDGRLKEIPSWAAEAVGEGVPAGKLVDEALIPAMNRVAELWQKGEYFVPEVLRAARTMQAGMDALKPLMVAGDLSRGIPVVIGTVKGDRHDIGKNLVGIMWQGVGYAVEDLGVDVPPERFLEAAQQGARVIGMSSLLTTTMPEMKRVIDLLSERGRRDGLLVLVGGAPVTPQFAQRIGADHYAKDAAEAVEVLKRRLG